MFGFPPEFSKFFLSAWQEEQYGVTLSWIELEIIRQSMIPKSINELKEQLDNKYQMIKKLPLSSFYRIIDNLILNEYLDAKKEGRSKIITSTPKGVKELGRLGRFVFEFQIEQLKRDLLEDIMEDVIPITGNILNQTVVVLADSYQTLLNIIDITRNIFTDEKYENNEILKRFHFINVDADTSYRTEYSSIWDAKIDNWPIKMEFADLIIEFSGITVFPDSDLIKEASRVLKKGGHLIIAEISIERATRLAMRFIREFTFFSSLINVGDEKKGKWMITDENKFTNKDKIIKMIENQPELEIRDIKSDVVTVTVIAKKK